MQPHLLNMFEILLVLAAFAYVLFTPFFLIHVMTYEAERKRELMLPTKRSPRDIAWSVTGMCAVAVLVTVCTLGLINVITVPWALVRWFMSSRRLVAPPEARLPLARTF